MANKKYFSFFIDSYRILLIYPAFFEYLSLTNEGYYIKPKSKSKASLSVNKI
jgi:hypothetical protein